MKLYRKLNMEERASLRKLSMDLECKNLKLMVHTKCRDKFIDNISECTPEGTVYIKLPEDILGCECIVYMKAKYRKSYLVNRSILVMGNVFDIKIMDLEILDKFTKYIIDKSTVELHTRDTTLMSPRDSIFRRYESIYGLSSAMKTSVIKSILGENTDLDLDSIRITGRRYIPDITKSGIGKLPGTNLFLTKDGLQLTVPRTKYLMLNIRYSREGIKVYIVTDIGYIAVFDGEDKYVDSTTTAYIMNLIINNSMIDCSTVVRLDSSDILKLVNYIHGCSKTMYNKGTLTYEYVNKLSKFLHRLKRRKFSSLYDLFSESETVTDKVIVDWDYYCDKLFNRYLYLGVDIKNS